MSKVNFGFLPTPPVTPEVCSFQSAAGEVTMRLRPLNDRLNGAYASRCEELIQRWVTGGWVDEKGEKGEKGAWRSEPDIYILPGEVLPLVGGLNDLILRKIAKVEIMQAGQEAEKYVFDDLVPMIEKDGATWEAICKKCVEIQSSYKPGKAWPVLTPTLTTQPSDTDSST